MVQRRAATAAVLVLLLLPATPAAAHDLEGSWWGGFGWPGTTYPVRSILSFRGDLYVSDGHCLLRWDDPTWTCVASGVEIDAMLVVGDQLYVGGRFTEIEGVTARNVARWDAVAEQWYGLGDGVYGYAYALAWYAGALVVGGEFDRAGDTPVHDIASYDGEWSDLGGGVDYPYGDSSVRSLYVDAGDLYAGGFFDTAGGLVSKTVARWDGQAWRSLATPFRGEVRAVVVHDGVLFVAGSLIFEETGRWYPIAARRDESWVGYDPSLTDVGYCFLVDEGELFAGGWIHGRGFARWDGEDWVEVDLDVEPYVRVAAVHDGARILGGGFDLVDGEPVFNIVRWETGSWQRMGPAGQGLSGYATLLCPQKTQPGGTVSALAGWNGQIIAGGDFRAAGTTVASSIGRWDGSQWSAMGNAGLVRDLARWGDGLAAASVGGVFAWDGTAWVSLIEDPIDWGYCGYRSASSVVDYQGSLVVGGSFQSIDGVDATNIVRWTGAGWEPLGTGVDYEVRDLAQLGDDLVVAGRLTRAGSTTVVGVAQWDGAAWSAMGDGLPGAVNALLVHEGQLYAGGDFQLVGESGSGRIARWDGVQWTPVAGAIDGSILALEFHGDRLIAAGRFDHVDGMVAANIAAWDGMAWEPLGLGIQRVEGGGVASLLSWSGRLYVGGAFAAAGGQPSFNIARWRSPDVVAAVTLSLSATPVEEGVLLRWNLVPPSTPAQALEIWRAQDGAFQRIGATDSGETSATSWVDRTALPGESYRYHVVARVGDARIVSNVETVRGGAEHLDVSRSFRIVPNPFHPQTEIQFLVGKPGRVTLQVLDLGGREIYRCSRELAAGPGSFLWNGVDHDGLDVASGVYFVRVRTPDALLTGRVLCLR